VVFLRYVIARQICIVFEKKVANIVLHLFRNIKIEFLGFEIEDGVVIIIARLRAGNAEFRELSDQKASFGRYLVQLYTSFQRQYVFIQLPQMLIRHIQDRLIHERIQVNVLWRHEDNAFNDVDVANISTE